MMRKCLLVGLWAFGALAAEAQLYRTPKNTDHYTTPQDTLGKKLGHSLTEDEVSSHMWTFSYENTSSEAKIRKNVVRSETSPFWSRRSVWADATMPARAAEFGAGKITREALVLPAPSDRWAASQSPETGYATKPQDDAILAAVYRHFFDYRAQGFGNDAHIENTRLHLDDVYFLGFGPHKSDAPSSLLAALQNDPALKRDGVTLRPISKSLEVTDEAIRDRDTGAYGPAFRVDAIGPVKDGEVRVMATFTERNGFWFTRELTLRQGKTGWEVEKDADWTLR
ncbi:MAG: hypothetical protein PHC88_13240 [Terrimicrobiaceae bacterium]|nr:hypothetical protein [Terrimicrobiaceae bacterium]